MSLPSRYAVCSCEPYTAIVLDFCLQADEFRESYQNFAGGFDPAISSFKTKRSGMLVDFCKRTSLEFWFLYLEISLATNSD
jgi:hypothetical protein